MDLKDPTSKGREGEEGRVRRKGKGFFPLFLSICWLRKSLRKFVMGVLEKSWIFLYERVGNLNA